jgi:diguanylate cyclase (GGDEF)-like protein
MADGDGFKQINDTLGHPAGDAVLTEVARRLRSDLRLYDVAGRYGGEEFILVLPGCDLHTAARRADEIRRLVARDLIATPAGTVSATVSMGVTVTSCDLDSTLETVLQNADAALYRAKKAGRNRVEEFSLNVRAAGKSR